jgi:Spy/CpxP family protein refolding chaperone
MRINEDRRGAQNGMNLTSEQRDAFKKSMMDTQKQLQPLRNQLGEVKAHQKTLMTAEKPDVNEVNKNIEKIGNLKVEMAKIQAKNRLEMRAQLTDDQRLMFDTHAGKMMHKRAGQGMRQGRGMQDAHPMRN